MALNKKKLQKVLEQVFIPLTTL